MRHASSFFPRPMRQIPVGLRNLEMTYNPGVLGDTELMIKVSLGGSGFFEGCCWCLAPRAKGESQGSHSWSATPELMLRFQEF